jgi:hypothetical protein
MMANTRNEEITVNMDTHQEEIKTTKARHEEIEVNQQKLNLTIHILHKQSEDNQKKTVAVISTGQEELAAITCICSDLEESIKNEMDYV